MKGDARDAAGWLVATAASYASEIILVKQKGYIKTAKETCWPPKENRAHVALGCDCTYARSTPLSACGRVCHQPI